MCRSLKISILLLLLPGVCASAEIEWTIAPYLWASDVGMDITLDDESSVGTEVGFKDLLDKVDMAFMGHIEGKGEKFGAYFDIISLDLSDTKIATIGPGEPISGDVTVDLELSLTIYELAGLYRFGNASPGNIEFDLIAGARQLEIDAPFTLTVPPAVPGPFPLEGKLDISETDFLLGGRLLGYFNERWGYNLRADYSAGGTDGVLNAHALIAYTFGQTGLFTLTGGYRYLTIELEDDADSLKSQTDLAMSGPLIGFVFNF